MPFVNGQWQNPIPVNPVTGQPINPNPVGSTFGGYKGIGSSLLNPAAGTGIYAPASTGAPSSLSSILQTILGSFGAPKQIAPSTPVQATPNPAATRMVGNSPILSNYGVSPNMLSNVVSSGLIDPSQPIDASTALAIKNYETGGSGLFGRSASPPQIFSGFQTDAATDAAVAAANKFYQANPEAAAQAGIIGPDLAAQYEAIKGSFTPGATPAQNQMAEQGARAQMALGSAYGLQPAQWQKFLNDNDLTVMTPDQINSFLGSSVGRNLVSNWNAAQQGGYDENNPPPLGG